jgi:hypothetical protein
MVQVSVRASIILKIREIVQEQALFNLGIVSRKSLNYPSGKGECTEGISFAAQMPLMSSRTWQEQQWESTVGMGVSMAATALAISPSCVVADNDAVLSGGVV